MAEVYVVIIAIWLSVIACTASIVLNVAMLVIATRRIKASHDNIGRLIGAVRMQTMLIDDMQGRINVLEGKNAMDGRLPIPDDWKREVGKHAEQPSL